MTDGSERLWAMQVVQASSFHCLRGGRMPLGTLLLVRLDALVTMGSSRPLDALHSCPCSLSP